jgi:hypothetical protein
MPDSKNYDLKYCPQSYWGPQDVKTHFGSMIKGELRRKAALQELEIGVADEGMLQSALGEDERSAVGKVHPWFMGGEYLGDLYPNEVEIARVVLKSTTMDVTSIRARQTKHRIVYRIVDEYGEREYTLKPKTSKLPLKMLQIINLIRINDLIDGPRDGNYECGSYCSPEEIYDFATVSSVYYPDLSRWFDEANEVWLEREQATLLPITKR